MNYENQRKKFESENKTSSSNYQRGATDTAEISNSANPNGKVDPQNSGPSPDGQINMIVEVSGTPDSQIGNAVTHDKKLVNQAVQSKQESLIN